MELENQAFDEAKIKEYQDKSKAFYEEQLPFLRIQKEHHELVAQISEFRVRHLYANQKLVDFELQKEAAEKKAKDEQNGGNQSRENGPAK